MINIKILTFIIVILLLTIIYFLYYRRESFSSQNCKDFKNVNIVFHNLDFEPTIGKKKLFNYTNKDFLDKFLVNNMNSIFRPMKIRFNNINLVEENMAENIRTHYDNFKKNYKSYGIIKIPENQDTSLNSDGADYSALLQSIRSNKLYNSPLPIRTSIVEEELSKSVGSKTMETPETNRLSSGMQDDTSNENKDLEVEVDENVDTVPNSLFGSSSNEQSTQQSLEEEVLQRLSEDEQTSYMLNPTELKNRSYDRMSRIQRFLIENNCANAYNALSNNKYTLEILIQEGQGLYTSETTVNERTNRFNIFFDRLKIPSIPDSMRVNLRESIINYDPNVVYDDAIIDATAILYSNYNFQGEQIILTEGEYNLTNIQNNISSEYKIKLDEDKDREWTINIGS